MGGHGYKRSWTDDDLRGAVRSARSWRGVARALGLKSTSTSPIRRHAARLRLDTSHFTGQRQWSDAQLKEAVSKATSWSDVLRALGISDSNDARARLKAHTLRLNLNVSHLSRAPTRISTDVASLLSAPPDLAMLRRAAPSIATVWFAMRGHAVSTPTEPEPYDLIVAAGDSFQRVQVKSTTCRAANGKWLTLIGRRPYVMDKSASACPYDPDVLDLFFIVDGDGGLYLFPSRVLAGQVRIQPESHPTYRVGDCSSLLS